METRSRKVNNREEWKKLGLMEKFNQTYTGGYVDHQAAKVAETAFIILFWLSNVVNIICFICYVIPDYLSDYSTASRTLFKVLILFTHAHIIIQWFLTRQYGCVLKSSIERNTKGNEMAQNGDHRVDMYNKLSSDDLTSSKFCDVCQVWQPPRAHHCKVCNVCILKRDHHCFLTGVCIGFHNQRHFIIMSIYSTLASVIGLVFSYLYLTSDLGPDVTSAWDYILPYIIYQWFTGQILIRHMLFSFLIYVFSWTSFICAGFLMSQIFCTLKGKTYYELKKGLNVPHTESLSKNVQSVFGDYWALNFLVPVHAWFPQPDAMDWSKDYKDS